ncbi:hypothetical protein [Sinomonas atrocyanea]|jgi:hypothetical protein|uniref:hypothetical protein n=1 Tax=Sinomonas atrocyanea TaxID=37927 RepID=UPI00278918CD|nr:hypothetical protein [Sinomonas atrocyanea]MDQ0261628.1 hypothetical protein [Sinomonas atrocyanea]MDR6621513.1 hypothetical protein [Sinomonas atrocyanea]
MESSHSRLRPRRRARLASAVLAALGVAVFGLGALPAQEAQAAGIAAGVRHVSAVGGQASAGEAVVGRAAAGSAPTARRDGRQA